MSKGYSYDDFMREMESFGIKINQMVEVSAEGKIPQLFKVMMFKRTADMWAKEFEKLQPEAYKRAIEIVDAYHDAYVTERIEVFTKDKGEEFDVTK